MTRRSPPPLEPVVSDHAVVRWLERVEGYPVEQVRAAILSSRVREALRLQARRVHLFDPPATLVLAQNTVVTVMPLTPCDLRGRR